MVRSKVSSKHGLSVSPPGAGSWAGVASTSCLLWGAWCELAESRWWEWELRGLQHQRTGPYVHKHLVLSGVMTARVLYSFPVTPVTKYHAHGGLGRRKVCSPSSGGWKSEVWFTRPKSRCQQDPKPLGAQRKNSLPLTPPMFGGCWSPWLWPHYSSLQDQHLPISPCAVFTSSSPLCVDLSVSPSPRGPFCGIMAHTVHSGLSLWIKILSLIVCAETLFLYQVTCTDSRDEDPVFWKDLSGSTLRWHMNVESTNWNVVHELNSQATKKCHGT